MGQFAGDQNSGFSDPSNTPYVTDEIDANPSKEENSIQKAVVSNLS